MRLLVRLGRRDARSSPSARVSLKLLDAKVTATLVVAFLLVDSDDQTSANERKLRSGNLTNLGNVPRSWELDSREEVLLEKALAPSQRRQLDDKDRGARSIFPLLVDENARIAFLRREMERRNCFSSYRW